MLVLHGRVKVSQCAEDTHCVVERGAAVEPVRRQHLGRKACKPMKAAKALGGLGRKAVPTRNKQKFGPSESLSFEDLLRKATAKTLPRPDPETNQQASDQELVGRSSTGSPLQQSDRQAT